ncbi:MAG: hypothetical protein JRI33_06260 [Deltaproteobacteria bacterium]|nr:hypothetical protein [Deltaproteobacteria bacterium]
MNKARNSPQKTIDLTEYKGHTFPISEFSFLSEQDFQRAAEILGPLVEVSRWGKEHLSFKAGSRVGVIETHGLRVQIRPALSVNEMVALIHYALSGRIPLQYLRAFAQIDWGTGFEDILCLLLATETEEILRVGLSRRYEKKCEPLDFLRGRPLWERNFPWRGARSKELTCRYHQITYDNPDNRLLLAGLRSAIHLARAREIKGKVFRHLKTLRDLASETFPDAAQFDQVAEKYNRLSEHYRTAHGLSRMLIFNLRPKSLYERGKQLAFGMVLDMADLFEKFIFQLMTDVLTPAGFVIQSQAPDRQALLDAEGQKYVSVRPDLLVFRSQTLYGVIDAKYKPYWVAAADGSPARRISNADIYQLFFYQQRFQRKFDLPKPPLAIIASPLPDEDERDDRPIIAHRFRRVIWQAGSEKAGDVRLLLVPMTKFLRFLIKRERPADIVEKIGLDQIRDLFMGKIPQALV